MRISAPFVLAAAALTGCGHKLDYPMPAADIQRLIDRDAIPDLRLHAWKILQTATKPRNGKPEFLNWQERAQIFPDKPNTHTPEPPNHLLNFSVPAEIALSLRSEQVMQGFKGPFPSLTSIISDDSCDLIPCELIHYNPSTVRDIRTIMPKGCDSLSDLARDLRTKPLAEHDIPDFSSDSIIVKSLWLLVDTSATIQIGLYDRPTVRRTGGPDIQYSTWKSCVAVRADPNLPLGDAKECGNTASLDDFYHFEIDRETANASTSLDYQAKRAAHTHAVLLGFHVTTREIPDWIWATYWWENRNRDRAYFEDRPASLASHRYWRNYAMDVAYDMVRPVAAEGVPKICFNPFLEGQLPNGSVSNCMSCHRAAGFHNLGPGVYRGKVEKDDDRIFNDMYSVRTDFLWSPIVHGGCKLPNTSPLY